MLQSNELRIGNYFNPIAGQIKLRTDVIFEVVEIRSFDVAAVNAGDAPACVENWPEFKYSEIAGIPLTPEILECAGFEKDDTHIGRPHYFHPGTMLFELATKWPSGRFRAIRKAGNFDGVIIGERIDYLHQLQNLYFAMTGEELGIKLGAAALSTGTN
jgi:hypothetical protein